MSRRSVSGICFLSWLITLTSYSRAEDIESAVNYDCKSSFIKPQLRLKRELTMLRNTE